MTKETVETQPTLPITQEIGAAARVGSVKKSGFRIGWEGAGLPGVLDTIRAADEHDIANVGAVLAARFARS